MGEDSILRKLLRVTRQRRKARQKTKTRVRPKDRHPWLHRFDRRRRAMAHWDKIKARRPLHRWAIPGNTSRYCKRPNPGRYIQKGDIKDPIGTRIRDRLVSQMQPGAWYSRDDVRRAAGYGAPARAAWMRMAKAGLIERVVNPDWHGPLRGAELGRAITARRVAPQWLYRLTATGEALKALVALLE